MSDERRGDVDRSAPTRTQDGAAAKVEQRAPLLEAIDVATPDGAAADPLLGAMLLHFAVEERIGEGGMGVVYRAHDTRLNRRVAIKVLKSREIADTETRTRLFREARRAASLRDPGIATVFEIHDEHEPPFFVMELVAGETLRARLSRGPLEIEAAVELALQVARALGHAHAAGIVHRDVKPENVFIDVSGRAKLLDFGIAKQLPQPAQDERSTFEGTTQTAEGKVLGTPEYMAPEQALGKGVDARADVFTLGVVLFEMLTGVRPFKRATSVETAVAIARDEPPDLRRLRPKLSPQLVAVIQRCLAKAPDARYADATALAYALETAPRIGKAGALSRPHVRRTVVAAGALAAVVGAVAVARSHRTAVAPSPSSSVASSPGPADAATAPAPRPALALWPLANASGSPRVAWMASALGEMLRTELSAGEKLRVIPRENVARTQRDLGIADTSDLARADVTRAASALGATLIVDGAYVVVESGGKTRVRLDLHVKDVATGDTLASIGAAGTEDELFELVQRAAVDLRRATHTPAPEPSAERMAQATIPAKGEATRAYADGITALQAMDYAKAREHLERAVGLDPVPPLPHSALSEALLNLGYADRAATEAKAALDSPNEVPREERLVMEARWREATFDWPGAVDRWRVLAGFFPDTLEYALALARAYVKVGQPKLAVETITNLRRHPGPALVDPRFDLVAGDAASNFDDSAMAEYARLALVHADALGSSSLAAEANALQYRWRTAAGKDLAALPAELLQLEQVYLALGNPRGAIMSILRAGETLARVGRWDEAEHELTRGLARAHELGYPGMEGRAELLFGAAWRRKNARISRPHLDRAVSIARGIGDTIVEAKAVNLIALGDWKLGRLAEAQKGFETAAKLSAAAGSSADEMDALDNQAIVLGDLGEAREALSLHEQMAKRFLEAGRADDAAITRRDAAKIRLDMGDVDGAVASLDEGERESANSRELHTNLSYRAVRADVAALQGNFEQARLLLRSAIDDSRKSGGTEMADRWERSLARLDVMHGVSRTADLRRWSDADPDDAKLRAALAASLALDGRLKDAAGEARHAVRSAAKAEVYMDRTTAALVAAGTLARTGALAEAKSIAEPIARDATTRGLERLALEARLVIAETTLGNEKVTRLEAVERDARSHGLVALAERATAARVIR